MAKRGEKMSEEYKKKISEGRKQFYLSGGIHNWEGKKHKKNTIKKLSKLRIGENNPMWGKKGALSGNWKGENVGYSAIHMWVANRFGRPKKCEKCIEKSKHFDWANISGKYKRVRSDWVRLCRKCHMRFDRQHQKAWATRRLYKSA